MYGREELEKMQMDGWEAYDTNDVNPVMDAMERRIARLTALVEGFKKNSLVLGEMYHKRLAQEQARIKELEEENKHLEDYIDAYQKSEALNIEKLDKKDERIKELEATISKMETTTPKWISVDKDWPIEYKKVLVSNPSAHTSKIAWKYRGHWFFDTNCDILEPTHWMLLPPSPTTEEK